MILADLGLELRPTLEPKHVLSYLRMCNQQVLNAPILFSLKEDWVKMYS